MGALYPGVFPLLFGAGSDMNNLVTVIIMEWRLNYILYVCVYGHAVSLH